MQCCPLSLNHSPIVHPVNGAKNWRDAAFEAVAATTVVYLRASELEIISVSY